VSVQAALELLGPEGGVAADAVGEPWASVDPPPEAVLLPASVEDASRVLQWAATERVSVIPAGSGRHLPPGSPTGRYVVLGSERMSGIESYEPADLTFTAGTGTRVSEIADALAANDQWLPADPPDVGSRSLGGLVALGDSGPLRTGYGALRNHVLGATLVTGDGRVLRLGGRVVKNVAGFDVLKPLVGSQGRLGFVASVCVRAFPVPATDVELTLGDVERARAVGIGLRIGTAPVLPVSCSVRCGSGGEGELVVRLHGAAETVAADRATLERHVGQTFEERPPVDHVPPTTSTVLLATVRPSRLEQALEAVDGVAPEWIEVDTYAAAARMGVSDADPDAITRLRASIEALDGALRVERAEAAVGGSLASSAPRPEEVALTDRITAALDPRRTFWTP